MPRRSHKPRHKTIDPYEIFNGQNAEDMPQQISVGDDEFRDIKLNKAFVAHSRILAIRRSGRKREGYQIGLYLEDDGIFSLKTTFGDYWLKDLKAIVDALNPELVEEQRQDAYDAGYRNGCPE